VKTLTQRCGSARRQQLVTQLARLKSKGAQSRFLARHSALLNAEVVLWLTDTVRQQAKVDASRAIRFAELGVIIARKLRDRNALAQSLRAMGNALHLSGENRAAIKSHDEACKLFTSLRNSTELARTLSATIQPMILAGQYKSAFSAAEKARRIFSAEGNEWRLARLELNAGNIYQRQGRFTEALECYQRAHAYFLNHQEKDPEAMGVALHNVAMCLTCLNDYPRALATYKNARGFAVQNGMDVLVRQADYNIALLHYFQGEYSRAVDLLRASLETFRQAKDRYHVALCHLDLSEIYLGLNRGGQAQEMAQQAAHDFQRLQMNYECGKSLANVALAMWQQGKASQALELFGQAREMLVGEENRIWPSRIDLYHAILCLEQERYAEARRLCRSAQKVFLAAKLPHYAILSRLLLTQLCLRTGKPDSARRHCSSALKELSGLDFPALRCEAHHLMGRIHVAGNRLNEAYNCYQDARQLMEALRSGLNREEFRISFMKNRLDIYEELVELSQARTPGRRGLEEAFEYVEQSKSRSLRDLLFKSGSEFHLASNLNPSLRARVRQLRSEIHWYSHRYENEQLRGAGASSAQLAEIQLEVRNRETELLRVIHEMPLSMAESAGLVAPKAVTVDEIRSQISPDCALLEFFRIRDHFVAIVIDRHTLEIVHLGNVSRVADLLARFQFQLSKFGLNQEYNQLFSKSLLTTTQYHLKALYDELLRPLRKHLSGDHLLIVPHGILHSLPFHALFDGKQYVIDSFAVSYAPSATIFSLCHNRSAKPSGSALVLGVPDEAAPLVFDEARAVAAKLPASDLFIGKNATSTVLQEKGKSCALIHIATHGYFRQDDPMFSGIRLGDGILSLYDLYQMSLPAQLVTLSGCATGLNVIGDGDELLGLVRGLIYAGAQSALLSLWDVHDRSTAEFMTGFYSQLSNTSDRSDAIRSATLMLRDTYPHPYHWAPFMLVGRVSEGNQYSNHLDIR
jgi:CHAT domain-containing protein/tetratricopeptide (TPR) repeat protein